MHDPSTTAASANASARPKMHRHGYVDDATADVNGHGRCRICALPESNRAHRLPLRTDEQKTTEARRVGETE